MSVLETKQKICCAAANLATSAGFPLSLCTEYAKIDIRDRHV